MGVQYVAPLADVAPIEPNVRVEHLGDQLIKAGLERSGRIRRPMDVRQRQGVGHEGKLESVRPEILLPMHLSAHMRPIAWWLQSNILDVAQMTDLASGHFTPSRFAHTGRFLRLPGR